MRPSRPEATPTPSGSPSRSKAVPNAWIARRLAAVGAVVTAVAIAALPAAAANFSVDPTSLTFARQAHGDVASGDIVVRNVGDETIRMSLHAYDWTQGREEREHLVETKRVSYYPQQFSLDPGASQRIRVGLVDKWAGTERAYRLVIMELPKPRFASTTGGAALSFYTRVDIPIFLDPAGPGAAAPRIPEVTLGPHRLNVILANDGNVHLPPSVVSVTLHDRTGKVIYHEDATAFYVLAQHEQAVHISIPASACANLGDALIQWSGSPSLNKAEVVPLRADQCVH